MAQEIEAASPGALAGDGAEALAVGTVAAGVLALATGQETVSPSAGTGAWEQEPHGLARLSFAVDPGVISKTFAVTQVFPASPTLAVTVAATQDGFDIIPSTQPLVDTLYVWTYAGT